MTMTVVLWSTSGAYALPAPTAVVELLEAVCLPMAEGDEPDKSVLTTSGASGGTAGEFVISWNAQSCRVIARLNDASDADQERLVKRVADWATGPVPQGVMTGQWGGQRSMYSVTNADDSLGYLGFVAYRGTATSLYFEFVWPAQDEES